MVSITKSRGSMGRPQWTHMSEVSAIVLPGSSFAKIAKNAKENQVVI
jgi:hypothetical protein